VDAVPHAPNESKRADITFLQDADLAPVRSGSARSEASAESHPQAPSPQLLSVERGRQWKVLAEQGESLGKLARKAGCSKSQARDLVMLGTLPEDLEHAYLQGKLGRKKVLALARARKSSAQTSRVTASGVQLQVLQGSHPAITESERHSEIEKYGTLVMDWVRSTDLAVCDWELFFRQVDLALYGPFRWLFSENAPRRDDIKASQDPWRIIKRCKPHLGNELSIPNVINNNLSWLARWIQMVIPDRKLIEEALATAKVTLEHEAWNAGYR